MMIYKDGDYRYLRDSFQEVDVYIEETANGELELAIEDHFSGEKLAEFKVIEEEEC